MLDEHDGLIPVSAEVRRGRVRGPAAVSITVLFFGALVATGFIDTAFPAQAPELTGLESELDTRRRESANFADGSLASLIEYDRRVTSSVRRAVLPHYSKALYKWFRFANPEVVVGKDGWLFLRSRVEPSRQYTEAAVEAAAVRLLALERAFAMHGTQLIVLPVPRKSALYSDKLPLGVDSLPEMERRLEEALARHGVTFAPLLDAFLDYQKLPQSDDKDPLYYKVGTHWTSRAELIAAEQVALALGLRKPDDELPTTVIAWRKKAQDSDLLAFAGFESTRQEAMVISNARRVGEFVLFEPGPPPRSVKLIPEEIGRIALAGTSFSAKRQLPQFISHYIREPVYNAALPGVSPIRSALDLLTLIDQSKSTPPEILVLEVPDHHAILSKSLELVEDVFATINPSRFSALDSSRAWWLSEAVKQRAPVKLEKKLFLATLKPQNYLHGGGGILAVRVSGTLKGGAAHISVSNGEESNSTRWMPRLNSVVVPLILPSFDDRLVRVYAESIRPDAILTIDREGIEIVGTYDSDPVGGNTLVAESSSSVLAVFADPVSLPNLAVLRFRSIKANPPGPLTLSAELDGNWHELGVFAGVTRTTEIILSLASHSGKALTRVRIDGLALEHAGKLSIHRLINAAD